MKLCLVAPVPPPYGGVANWEEIIVNEIKKHDDISLTLINIAPNKRPMDGRTIFDRVFYSGFVMLKAYHELKRNVRSCCPDVVHMTTSGGLGFFRDLLFLNYLHRKRIPSVYHIHFGRTIEYRKENGRCWRQITKAVSIADATIVLDEKSYELLEPYAKKIVKINNPIDVDTYKKFIDIKQEKNKISYIGWIIKPKGIEELLIAFHDFNRKHSYKYTLELIGPGDPNYIKKLLETYNTNNVFFLGEVDHDEAMKRLASSYAFILPSYTEGFPNVVLEAMALKKGIIATDVGALPEMLENNAGILIKPKDVKQIFNALESIIDEQYKNEMAKNTYKRVNEFYDVKPTYEKYCNLWKSVKRIDK